MAIQVKNDNVLIGHINELENAVDNLDSRLDVVEDKFSEYLPLTGGGLTGPVTSSSNITASGGFIGNLGEEQLNKVNIKTWVDTASNIHTTGKQGEMIVKRFFASGDEANYSSSYDLPVVDSHNLIFSIDNSTQWQRILSLDMRTNDIWTTGKSGATWRSWQKVALEGTYFPMKIITAGSDFNSYKTTGWYIIRSGGNTNFATSAGNHGVLFVCFDIGTPFQIYWGDSSTAKARKRYYTPSTATWSAWFDF